MVRSPRDGQSTVDSSDKSTGVVLSCFSLFLFTGPKEIVAHKGRKAVAMATTKLHLHPSPFWNIFLRSFIFFLCFVSITFYGGGSIATTAKAKRTNGQRVIPVAAILKHFLLLELLLVEVVVLVAAVGS
jgi:ABC-type sugar transport system permease subunit